MLCKIVVSSMKNHSFTQSHENCEKFHSRLACKISCHISHWVYIASKTLETLFVETYTVKNEVCMAH